jgi:hypothetical protein
MSNWGADVLADAANNVANAAADLVTPDRCRQE